MEENENPLRDVLFCLVWVVLFFAFMNIALKNRGKEIKTKKAEAEAKKPWRYLDDPPPEY